MIKATIRYYNFDISNTEEAAQLLWHIGKVDTSECSPMMQDAIQHVREMAASDVFSDEYRTELDGQKWE